MPSLELGNAFEWKVDHTVEWDFNGISTGFQWDLMESMGSMVLNGNLLRFWWGLMVV